MIDRIQDTGPGPAVRLASAWGDGSHDELALRQVVEPARRTGVRVTGVCPTLQRLRAVQVIYGGASSLRHLRPGGLLALGQQRSQGLLALGRIGGHSQ